MDIFINKKEKNRAYLSNSVNIACNSEIINLYQNQMANFDAKKMSHSRSNSVCEIGLRFRSPCKLPNNNYSRQNSFIHDSIQSSLDFPTYIPWQSLSSEVNDNLKSGVVRINKSNCLEWATPIEEINEKTFLLNKGLNELDIDKKRVTQATNPGISWQVASFLLVNCALGAGILNYPQAYDKVGGIVIATILQLILMTVLGFTMLILVYSSDLNGGNNTYHDVILSMCGKKTQQLAAVSIMLTCYGICVTFLIIIGDQMEKVVVFLNLNTESHWYIDRKFIISFLSLIFILPMCYFKRLDFLKYAGTLGVFSMLYVVFINVYQYFYLNCEQVELRKKPESLKSMVAVIPVICFAYQTHEIVIPVYASMKNRTVKNFSKTTVMTLSILFVLYSLAGTFAYLTFGKNVSSDIMLMYDAKQPLVVFGTFALVVKMITTYPPMVFCGRGALDGLYAEFFKLDAESFIKGAKKRRIIITTLWFFSTLFLAIYTPNIGLVIELLGSLASMNVFIFPSICLIVIVDRLRNKISKLAKTILYSFSGFLIIFGIMVFFIVISDVYAELKQNKNTEFLINVTYCKNF